MDERTAELNYLIENAEQGSDRQEIEAGEAARKELEALTADLAQLRARVTKLETVLEEIADPNNSHKRDGSVYIPDVVATAARSALGS
jgi:cell division protein FtsB